MLYIIEYQIVDINRTDEFPPEVRTRKEIINDLQNVAKKYGYTSHCCYNLDGSIDIKMTKETEYFGTQTISGTVKKLTEVQAYNLGLDYSQLLKQ